MKPLPMPIRIAAGLVATALEEVQGLPRKLTEMPVTAVSGALQASMRLQQRITELAIKGDRALGALRPVPETPAWARFDEEDDLPPRGGAGGGLSNGLRAVDTPRPPKVTPVRILPDPEPEDIFEPDTFTPPERSELPVPRPPVDHPGNGLASGNGLPGAAELSAPAPTKPATSKPAAAKPAGAKPAASKPSAGKTPADEPSATTPAARKPAAAKPSAAKPSAAKPSVSKPSAEPALSGPPGLTEYGTWSLPQLRGRFRALSLAQLEQLLAWETSHLDRPPYVTMLSNRITSVAGR
ncbi:MAG TPA: lipid droplet-associated protein [Pseudonocardia sp.]|jgi:hypothetical protein|nr:lipid droplet-associated protein [Pseudonocardia sp.]